MAYQTAAMSTSRTKILVAVVAVAVIIAASLVTEYTQAVNHQRGTESVLPVNGTTTTTATYPCPSSLLTQTNTTTAGTGGSSKNRGLDFGPLLGNFSTMTVAMFGNGSNGKSFTTSTMTVLSRSPTAPGAAYEVNVTTKSIEPQVTVSYSQSTTTTITSTGNVTRIGSVLADIARNGSVVSTKRSSGNLSSPPLPLESFVPLLLQNYSSANSRAVSTATVTIGTTRMSVTNLALPVLVNVIILQGCNGAPPTKTTLTISDWEVQVGQVPGTDFTLVTRFSQIYSVRSSSTTTSSSGFSVNEEVTGFTVA